MKSFEAKWSDLKASGSAQDEATRVEEVAAILRTNHIVYQLAISDRKTAGTIPLSELGLKPDARLRVDLTADDGATKRRLTWDPRDPANVFPLLRE